MHRSIFTFVVLLLTLDLYQSYPCSCSCCFGRACQAVKLPNSVDAPSCTDASCLAACKARYYQCNVSPPDGQAIGRCESTTTTTTTHSSLLAGPYACRYDCCHTGSYACNPSFVGSTNAYTCNEAACSIACNRQYPSQCVNNQSGQTRGTCTGPSMSTPSIPQGSVRCGCSCCANSVCHSYEVVTGTGCSSCSSACQSVQWQCFNHQNTYCFT